MSFVVVEFLDENAVEVVVKDWIEECGDVRLHCIIFDLLFKML
jgi:hypothetical protein